jgi:putative transposase
MRLIRSERDAGSPLSIARMCRLLSISRAAFYRWCQPKANRDDMDVRSVMHEIALEHPWYGYRPMTHELRRRAFAINEKRVRRLMRLDNLVGSRRSLRTYLRTKRHNLPRYENLAAGFVATGLDQMWFVDLTYVRLRNAFIFVAIVLDAFSRRCIGWAIAEHMRTELTLEALEMAIRRRRPKPGLIHHGDQGVQFAALEYIAKLTEHGIRPSMSRAGTPTDNAICERFMKTLKYEEVLVNEYTDIAHAMRSIPHFIEIVYNRKRLHSALGYVPPAEFEANHREQLLQPIPA